MAVIVCEILGFSLIKHPIITLKSNGSEYVGSIIGTAQKLNLWFEIGDSNCVP